MRSNILRWYLNMAIGNIKTGKLLYHLTRLSNLGSILKNGLVSRKLVEDNDVHFFDVADQEIITISLYLCEK